MIMGNFFARQSARCAVSKGFREYLMIYVMLMNITAGLCASSGGYKECPCIDENNARFSAAQTQLSNVGYPDGYGARGCKQYDLGLKLSGCDVPDPAFFCDRYLFFGRCVTVIVMSMCLVASH